MRSSDDAGLVGFSRRLHNRFAHDKKGRLISSGLNTGHETPRYYLGRTAEGNLWRFAADLPPSIVIDLARWSALEGPIARESFLQLEQPPDPERWPHLVERLAAHQPVLRVSIRPVLLSPSKSIASRDADGDLLHLTEPTGLQSDPFFEAAAAAVAAGEACFVKRLGGEFVASCHTRRRGRGGEAELTVLTRDAYRGQGHAREVVVGWSEFVRRQGQFPIACPHWEDRSFLEFARHCSFRLWGEDRTVY